MQLMLPVLHRCSLSVHRRVACWDRDTPCRCMHAMNDHLRNRASELRKLTKVTPEASSVGDI
jgi:hypothetical protein